MTRFACYYFLPNNFCGGGRNSSGRGDAPCKELCYKAQLDCVEEMEEIGFLWPEHIDCSSLPEEKDGFCESFGITGE